MGRSNTDEAGIDSAEESERMRGVWELEAAAVESTTARSGYTIPAAWDEGTLIQAMARLDDPTLRWRYGMEMLLRKRKMKQKYRWNGKTSDSTVPLPHLPLPFT